MDTKIAPPAETPYQTPLRAMKARAGLAGELFSKFKLSLGGEKLVETFNALSGNLSLSAASLGRDNGVSYQMQKAQSRLELFLREHAMGVGSGDRGLVPKTLLV